MPLIENTTKQKLKRGELALGTGLDQLDVAAPDEPGAGHGDAQWPLHQNAVRMPACSTVFCEM